MAQKSTYNKKNREKKMCKVFYFEPKTGVQQRGGVQIKKWAI